jgi:hypothetical protein
MTETNHLPIPETTCRKPINLRPAVCVPLSALESRVRQGDPRTSFGTTQVSCEQEREPDEHDEENERLPCADHLVNRWVVSSSRDQGAKPTRNSRV